MEASCMNKLTSAALKLQNLNKKLKVKTAFSHTNNYSLKKSFMNSLEKKYMVSRIIPKAVTKSELVETFEEYSIYKTVNADTNELLWFEVREPNEPTRVFANYKLALNYAISNLDDSDNINRRTKPKEQK